MAIRLKKWRLASFLEQHPGKFYKTSELSRKLGYSISSVRRVLEQFVESGQIEKRKNGIHNEYSYVGPKNTDVT